MGLSREGNLLSKFKAKARPFQLNDLPLMVRLKRRGISLDSESYLARGLHTLEDAALSRLPLADLGTPTLLARYGHASTFGQFRHQAGDSHAHIVFIAPALTDSSDESLEGAWLHLLDALAKAAARRGAHMIYADVAENSAVFTVLRQAGYAPYAQQELWRRPPGPVPGGPSWTLRRAVPQDAFSIRQMHAAAVPRLARQADPLPAPSGWVAMNGETLCGYLAVNAGSRGVYLKPYLHPDAEPHAQAILAAGLAALPATTQLPIYCRVHGYQGWLGGALEALGFTPWARQTIMVKHTSVRVKHPAFDPLPAMPRGVSIPGGHGGEG